MGGNKNSLRLLQSFEAESRHVRAVRSHAASFIEGCVNSQNAAPDVNSLATGTKFSHQAVSAMKENKVLPKTGKLHLPFLLRSKQETLWEQSVSVLQVLVKQTEKEE